MYVHSLHLINFVLQRSENWEPNWKWEAWTARDSARSWFRDWPSLWRRKRRKKDGRQRKASSVATAEDEEESNQDAAAEPSSSAEDQFDRMDFAAYPQILVHPSRTAKNGKFNCSLVSLSVLLDYRPEDTKVKVWAWTSFVIFENSSVICRPGFVTFKRFK